MRTRLIKQSDAFLIVLVLSVSSLVGCSEQDDASGDTNEYSVTQNNAMDVKQPEPKARPMLSLSDPITARPKPSVPAPSAAQSTSDNANQVVSGKAEYIRCIGCHGVSGDGGVGPRLNNQKPDAIVAKLEKYKAGERVGPLSSMMIPLARDMSTEQMQAVATFITSQ